MKTIIEKLITRTAGAMLKSVGTPPSEQPEEDEEQMVIQNEEIILYPEVKPKESKELILKEISSKMDRCMERHKLFLDPGLSLNRIANLVGSNRTYISNIMASKNGFHNYLNEWRLRYMAQRLRKELNSPKAQEDISMVLSEPDEIITPTRLTALVTACGFVDMRSFRRALHHSKSDYAEEIKGYIY